MQMCIDLNVDLYIKIFIEICRFTASTPLCVTILVFINFLSILLSIYLNMSLEMLSSKFFPTLPFAAPINISSVQISHLPQLMSWIETFERIFYFG